MKKCLILLSLVFGSCTFNKSEAISVQKAAWGTATFVSAMSTLYSAGFGALGAALYAPRSSNLQNLALTGTLLLATKYFYDKYQKSK